MCIRDRHMTIEQEMDRSIVVALYERKKRMPVNRPCFVSTGIWLPRAHSRPPLTEHWFSLWFQKENLAQGANRLARLTHDKDRVKHEPLNVALGVFDAFDEEACPRDPHIVDWLAHRGERWMDQRSH